MADPLLSVRAGAADPPTMALPRGQAIGPLAVGRAGTWRVVAPGVLEEHAFLYFNGTDLFLQSANPNSPVTVNGAPIPGDWTPVYAPCEISFGGARVWFGPPEQARSRPPPAAPSRPPPAARSQPFVPRVHGVEQDDECTRLQPIEEIQASRPRTVPPQSKDPAGATLKSPVSHAPPSVGAPTFGAPPSVMGPGPLFGPPPPMPAGAPPAMPGVDAPPGMPPPGVAPPATPPKKESWIGARWREASTPKKALMVLILPLIWAVWVIFTDKPPPARPTKPAASASASPSSAPSAGAPSATAAATGAPPADAQPPPAPTGKASTTTSSTAKTPQREAADAVAAGAYDKAARLYEELAKAHPEVPAYAEAARIMKAKARRR